MIEIGQIEKNYNTFRSLCEKLGDRSENVLKLIDHLGERLVIAPGGFKDDYGFSYPGGLVDKSLKILDSSYKQVKIWDIDDISKESLILCSLFCSIGHCGNKDEEMYHEQTNQWRQENLGENYVFNNDIRFMRVPHRSLYLLQEFNISLTQEEWLSILMAGSHDDEVKSYSMNFPQLALIIRHSSLMVQSFIS